MCRILRQLLFVLFFAGSRLLSSQQPLTKEQIRRLADAGKVYGYVKYFHPFLQYKNIDWDSVFAASVEGIIKAANRDEYAAAMQRMLSSLNDDLSTVSVIPVRMRTYHEVVSSYSVKDSILYFNMNDAPSYAWGNPNNVNEKLQEALKNLSRVKGVVFDMRTPPESPYTPQTAPALLLDWNALHFKGDLVMPSRRSMGYSGLNWEAFFRQSNLYEVHGSAEREVPLVFIVSNDDQVPLSAIVLQQMGKAAIVQENGKQLQPGSFAAFHIADSILVQVRTDEAVNRDGFSLLVQPNATYSATEPRSAAIELAEKLIREGFHEGIKPTQHAPLPITRPSNYHGQGNYPSAGYRMLAAAKIFSIVKYFFAGKDLMDSDWGAAYEATIPKFIAAADSTQFRRAIAELYANIQDSHGFVTRTPDGFSLRLNPVIQGRGNFISPVIPMVVENIVVVDKIYDDSVAASIGVRKGDVILSIDGKNPMQMVEEARKYQSASTKASQTLYVSSFLTFGEKGQVHKVRIIDVEGRVKVVSIPTLREFTGDFYRDGYSYAMFSQHREPTVKWITKDVGYADLTSRLTDADNDSIVAMLKRTKAFIFDMRGYPHGLGINPFADLFAKKTHQRQSVLLAPSAQLVTPNPISGEGRITMTYRDRSSNSQWVFRGKTVVLTDESAQSWGEDVVAYLKDAGATVVGSPTAGALAGTTNFDVPGNITLWLSDSITLLPDGKTYQRLGVQPDIWIRPTIKGLQSGRDEVLERAVRFLQTGK